MVKKAIKKKARKATRKKTGTIKLKLNQENLRKFITVGVILVLALVSFNILTISQMNSTIATRVVEMKEEARPAEIELVSIVANCANCFSTDSLINSLKTSDSLNIISENRLQSSSDEARTLVEKYSITKFPAIIVTGETVKASLPDFDESGDALVYSGVTPPYVDVGTGDIIGLVSAIIIKEDSCESCHDFGSTIQSLRSSGVIFLGVARLDLNSSEAAELIASNGIEKAPSLLLSKNIGEYSIIQDLIQSGLQQGDEYYLLESQLPYVNASSGEIRGMVSLTMITDNSCASCYDVTLHKAVLARFGMAVESETTVDINSSEGKALLDAYNITKVPTIVVTGDANLYESFNSIWRQVGDVAEDGAHIFREPRALGNVVFTDLSA